MQLPNNLDRVVLRPNKPQLRFRTWLPRIKEAYNILSRATGKSVEIAWLIHTVNQTMPRSTGAIVGSTYQKILTRTLPSTMAGLEKLGYIKDRDYFIGRKPKDLSYNRYPYEQPVKYDNFMIFPKTGTGFHLVSLDKGGGSARGLNVDIIASDESLEINKKKYDDEVTPTNRGNKQYFKHIPYHHGVFHFSSMPYGNEGMWLLEAGNYYQEQFNYNFTALRNKQIDLQLQFIQEDDIQERLKLWKEIDALGKQIIFYGSKEQKADGKKKKRPSILYHEANVFDNIQNVGIDFIEDQYRRMPLYKFLTEILNKRPLKVEQGFYPMLDMDYHAYTDTFDNNKLRNADFDYKKVGNEFKLNTNLNCILDLDLDGFLPLRLAVDWGASLSSLSVAQLHPTRYRFLKSFYVKHPQLIEDLVNLFDDYYKYHKVKIIDFIPDRRWGNAKNPGSSLTYNEKFVSLLRKKGWMINFIDIPLNISHQDIYLIWHELLRRRNTKLMEPEFNRTNCKDLLLSMSLTPSKQGSNGIQKNKNSERNPNIPQEEATHLGDTADLHILSIGMDVIQQREDFLPAMFLR